jgi:bifunctional DNA-binding transcriptional regulator/antitoxin component of YhaV-PrlF toxin-antitoxin module
MSAVHLRERRQITLPVDIVAAAGLTTDDKLEASFVNGVIHLVPHSSPPRSSDMRRFLGAAKGIYGADDAAVNTYVNEQREAW